MKAIIILDVLIIMIFITATASVSLAKLIISTRIDLREEYNDNIFLDPTAKEDDYITTVFPTIELHYDRNKYLDMYLKYGLRYLFYRHHSDLNDTSVKDTQNAELQAEIKPSDHSNINISDMYERVPIDIRRQVAEGNDFINMTERNTFTFSPTVTLPMTPSISQTIGYSYINVWNSDVALVDSESHFAFLTLNKRFSSRVNGTVKYEYIMYEPDLNNNQNEITDYDRHQGSLEMQYKLSSQFNVNALIGQAWTDFQKEDDTTFTFWNAGTEYISGSSSIGVHYSFMLNDSATSGAFENSRIDMNFITGRSYSLTIHPYYETDKYLNVDREDEIVGSDLSISRSTKKITVTLRGALEKLRFMPEEEEVIRYNAEITMDHKLSRKISTHVGYNYNRRNSNIDANDFDNHIVRIQARLSL